MDYRAKIILVIGIVLMCACENTSTNLKVNDVKNDIMADTSKTALQDEKNYWILSTDSIWKLRICPMVGHINRFEGSYGKITTDPMHFCCVEVQLSDTSKDIHEFMPGELPILPRAHTSSYRSLFISDKEYIVYSTLEVMQKDMFKWYKSIQFVLDIHSLDTFSDSVEITLSHIGGNRFESLLLYPDEYPNGYPVFQITNLHNLIMPFDTTLYDKNAPLADENWFKKKNLNEYLPKKIK